jgi:hypothetical protein
MELAKVSCAEDPQKAAENPSASLGIRNKGPIHGIADGNFPSVLPLGKNIRFVTGGNKPEEQQDRSRGEAEAPPVEKDVEVEAGHGPRAIVRPARRSFGRRRPLSPAIARLGRLRPGKDGTGAGGLERALPVSIAAEVLRDARDVAMSSRPSGRVLTI